MTGGHGGNEFDSGFYAAWAEKQLHDPLREIVLHWKAVHLASLFRRRFPEERPHTICEIGGAEGTVLFSVGGFLDARDLHNYEPVPRLREAGRAKYPGMHFPAGTFNGGSDPYDIVILSDILEHVEDDAALLADASARCRFALIKMPIERSISVSPFGYFLRGTRRPAHMVPGHGHYNGHLRCYKTAQALSTVRKSMEVIDWYALDHSFYYRGSARFAFFRRWMGMSPLLRIFGGSLFILARGTC
jgi:hypothetical protein